MSEFKGESALPFSLSAVILLVLVTAHMWFSQVVSALMVTLIAAYVILDICFPFTQLADPSKRDQRVFLAKFAIVLLLVLLVVFVPTGWEMLARVEEGAATHANDGLVQTEIAIEYLLEGKNPYTETYLGTPLEAWQGGEPPFTPVFGPLYHYVYLPFTFLLGAPLYLLTNQWGWYDQRLVHMILLALTMLLLTQLARTQQRQLLLLMIVGFNFLFVFHFIEGRNDIAILVWMVLATLFLAKGHVRWAALVLGLALATKHQAWFFLPFFMAYTAVRPFSPETIRSWLKNLWPMAMVLLLVIGPFFLWDPTSFFQDTTGYIVGLSEFSFPIRGIGFSHLLVATGLLPSYEASFPFIVLSLLFGIPVMAYGLRLQWRANTLRNMWMAFAFFAFTFQYFSRFFNDNYFVFVVLSLSIAAFIDIDQVTTHEIVI